jgi:replication-associated recombination protein RarA
MESNNTIHRIVLTGGPGAGKTTAADLLRREIGEAIIIVPEAATMIFSSGFPRYKDTEARKATQSAIYHIQKNLEDVQARAYPHRTLGIYIAYLAGHETLLPEMFSSATKCPQTRTLLPKIRL